MRPNHIMEISMPSCLSSDAEGKALAFQLRKPEGNAYRHTIMLYRPEQADVEALTEGRRPALAPDGQKLAFLQGDEIIVMELSTRGKRSMGAFTRCRDLSWAPDSRRLCFTAAVQLPYQPDDLPELEHVVWVDRLKFKCDGEGMHDGRYRQLFVLDVTTGQAVQVTSERYDHGTPAFLGSERVIATCIPVEPDNSDFSQVMVYDLATGARQQYPGPGGPITRVACSHGGSKVAYLSHDNSQWEATNFKVYVLDTKAGTTRCLTAQVDRSMGNYSSGKAGQEMDSYRLEWSGDDRFIYTLMSDKSRSHLVQVEEESGEVKPCVEGRRVLFDYTVTPNGTFYLYSSTEELAHIRHITPAGKDRSVCRSDALDGVRLATLEAFTFPGWDGTDREGFYMAPLTSKKGVVMDVHGGPHYLFGEAFSIDWQLLAANGFGVVFCNPAGSQGYGEDISKASKHDWGGKDYNELTTCVEVATKRFGLAGDRWGVFGGSYGGYLANWIVGHTDFFACAISERGTCNRYSQSGTSDCAYRYGEFEFKGYAWDNPDFYMERSPITYVRKASTPLLLVHGEQDMNCSISQSEEMYSAMKIMGKEVYFARFPGQAHSFAAQGSPEARIDRYKLLLWWMDKYLGLGGKA